MKNCIHLKNKQDKPYCKMLNKHINFSSCVNCEYKQYKVMSNNKSALKVPKTPKIKHVRNDKRFSILTDDLTRCIECGRSVVQLHEIYYGHNRNNSKDNGFVIPLCIEKHHNGNTIGIHKDIELDDKWKELCQLKYEETKTRQEFIKIIGKNYILD